jgi:hypothetical protein
MPSLLEFFRKKENWPIVVIPALLLLWAQFGATSLALSSFNNLSFVSSPYRGNSPYLEPLPETQPGQPVTKRVVLIVVDALRVDTSQAMPALNGLRQTGASRVSVVGVPSFSLPGWTVIGTGAWQEQSGFAANSPLNHIDLDTIFLSAKRSGLKTALVGSREWAQLYNQGVDIVDTPKFPATGDHYHNLEVSISFDKDLGKRALAALEQEPDLALFYFEGVDEMSHGFGGISQQATDAAANVDQQIAMLLEQIDLSDTVVIVTSDHGQIDKGWDGGGGHGGGEPVVLRTPLIAAGQGIRQGEYPDATQADIAPTVAALLGLAIPAHNQGDILLDMLDTTEDIKAARSVDNAAQLANRYGSMLTIICESCTLDRGVLERAQGALAADDTAAALDLAAAARADIRGEWNAVRDARIFEDRMQRLPIGLWFLIPLAVYVLWWARAGWEWKAPLVAGIVYFVLWNLIYYVVRGLTNSITMFNTEEAIFKFVEDRVSDTIVLLALAMVIVGLWRKRAGAGEIARDAANTLFVIAAGLMVQITIFYILWGLEFNAIMPDLSMGFKYYMDVFQTTAFWPILPLPLAAILPLLAILVGWAANRVADWRA